MEKENITSFTKRMRELCGLELKEGFEVTQKPEDLNLRNENEPTKEEDKDYTIFKFEQKDIQKRDEDDELYPLANQ